jgi:hypothetical protein
LCRRWCGISSEIVLSTRENPVLPLIYSFFPSWEHVGGSPTASHFSCFAKKSNQKKATAKPLPAARVPEQARRQAGSAQTRCAALRSNSAPPLSACHLTCSAASQRGIQVKSKTKHSPSIGTALVAVAFDLVVDLGVPVGEAPKRRWFKRIRSEICLSEASLFHFPLGPPALRVPRRGALFGVAFLWLLSLAKQRKVKALL